jgi:Domain of unknown function (DUF4268)
MYTREEASQIKQQFWTAFGKYMAPVLSAEGEKINWINYKTGVRLIHFKMDVSKEAAYIGIEITHKDVKAATQLYGQFELLQDSLVQSAGEQWEFDPLFEDEHGRTFSRIFCQLKGVNIYNQSTWPQIISFLKPRIINLDHFWSEHKMIFELMA